MWWYIPNTIIITENAFTVSNALFLLRNATIDHKLQPKSVKTMSRKLDIPAALIHVAHISEIVPDQPSTKSTVILGLIFFIIEDIFMRLP